MPRPSTSAASGWLGCRDCGTALPLLSHALVAADDTDLTTFLAAHAGHSLTHLRIDGDAIQSTHPMWDPAASAQIQVTNGEKSFVLSLSRDSIDAPPTVHFRPGSLSLVEASVSIEESHLRRAVEQTFYPLTLGPTKLDRFIGMVRETVGRTDASVIELLFDDAVDPDVTIGRMPEALFETIVALSAAIFSGADLERLRVCLETHRADDGVLTLRVRRRFKPQADAGLAPPARHPS